MYDCLGALSTLIPFGILRRSVTVGTTDYALDQTTLFASGNVDMGS